MARVLWLVLVLSPLAHADEDFDVVAARRHFVKAKAQLAKGNYESALHEFQVARTIKPLPDLDYDVARCLDALERYPEAIIEYEKYLSHSPPDDGPVKARIQVLHDRLSAIDHYDKPPAAPVEKPVETAPPVEKAPPPVEKPAAVENLPAEPILAAEPARQRPKPIYKRWWLWTAVGGAAVVIVAVGLGVGLSSSSSPTPFQPSLMSFGPGAK